jgi:hypothetical protein
MTKKNRKKRLAQEMADPARNHTTGKVRVTQASLLFGNRRKPRRWNVRFIVLLAIWIIALIVALLYVTHRL